MEPPGSRNVTVNGHHNRSAERVLKKKTESHRSLSDIIVFSQSSEAPLHIFIYCSISFLYRTFIFIYTVILFYLLCPELHFL